MIRIELNTQDTKSLRRILLHYAAIVPAGPESILALRLYGDIDYAMRQSGEDETCCPN